MPVISPVSLSNKSLRSNEHMHNNYTIKSCVSTLKSTSFAVYEIAAKTTNMPGNSKRITSKRSTSTLAYFLCMSQLLTTSYPGSFFGEGKTLVGAGHVTLTKLIA